MRATMTVLLAAALAWSAPLRAGEPISAASAPPPYSQAFSDLDTNRDGVLSFSEAFSNPRISNNFNLLDTNADGVLSPDEVRGVVALR